jgi:hypothetical protein
VLRTGTVEKTGVVFFFEVVSLACAHVNSGGSGLAVAVWGAIDFPREITGYNARPGNLGSPCRAESGEFVVVSRLSEMGQRDDNKAMRAFTIPGLGPDAHWTEARLGCHSESGEQLTIVASVSRHRAAVRARGLRNEVRMTQTPNPLQR